jgi:hypothetical protein
MDELFVIRLVSTVPLCMYNITHAVTATAYCEMPTARQNVHLSQP